VFFNDKDITAASFLNVVFAVDVNQGIGANSREELSKPRSKT
jgi:hypothetical protein